MRSLFLCGAGNSEGVRLALCINRARSRWERILLLDDDPDKHGRSLLGVEIVGGLELLAAADPARDEVASFVARTTARRAAVRVKLESYGLPFATLIHPSVDTLGAQLASDVIVYEHATISPEVRIGESSVVFMGAVVGHESTLGRGCVCAAGSVLNARVELGDGVYVGTNASILPEVRVGARSTIGANTVVIGAVPSDSTVIGVPGEVFEPRLAGPTLESSGPEAPSESLDPHLLEAIRSLWSELLRRDSVGLRDNFFDLGGSSLLALQMAQRLRDLCAAPISVTDAFRFPTIEALTAHLCRADAEAARSQTASRAAQRARARREKRAAG